MKLEDMFRYVMKIDDKYVEGQLPCPKGHGLNREV